MKTLLEIGNLCVNFEVIVFVEFKDDYICITTKDPTFRRIQVFKKETVDETVHSDLSPPYDTTVNLTEFNFNIMRSNLRDKIFTGEE